MSDNHHYELMGTTYKICAYFDSHHIENLRYGVHKLFRCAGDGKRWEDEDGQVSLSVLIKLLKGFLKDGYQTLNKHIKDGYTYYNCGTTIKEPFIVGEQCLETDFEKSYLRRVKAFQGEIQLLNKEEAANFYIPLKEFFLFDDREAWNNKLNEWKKCAKKGISIHDKRYFPLDRSIQSYFQLLRFLETCCIIHKAFNRRFGICPAWMLFESDQTPFYVDPYGAINPFEELNKFFATNNAKTMKTKLSSWIDAAKTKGRIWDEGEPTKLIEFYERLNKIIETCWMLHDSYYLLEDWLNPENFDVVYPPLPETSGSYRPEDSSLSVEEIESPIVFLEHCLFDSSIVSERKVLSDLLKCALSKDMVTEDQGWLHEKLPMMIDALYILNAWIFERTEAIKNQK